MDLACAVLWGQLNKLINARTRLSQDEISKRRLRTEVEYYIWGLNGGVNHQEAQDVAESVMLCS